MTATDRPDPTAPAPLSEPTSTPRRRGPVIGRVVALVLIAGGLTAAAACTPGADNVAAPAPTTTSATTAAPTPTEPPPYAGPLQAVTVPMPAGAVAAASERKGDADGSLSLAQAASEYDAADQASVTAALKDAEYQRGVFLAWRTGGTLVYVQVYQFRYDREAASWTVSQQRGIEGIATSTRVLRRDQGRPVVRHQGLQRTRRGTRLLQQGPVRRDDRHLRDRHRGPRGHQEARRRAVRAAPLVRRGSAGSPGLPAPTRSWRLPAPMTAGKRQDLRGAAGGRSRRPGSTRVATKWVISSPVTDVGSTAIAPVTGV